MKSTKYDPHGFLKGLRLSRKEETSPSTEAPKKEEKKEQKVKAAEQIDWAAYNNPGKVEIEAVYVAD